MKKNSIIYLLSLLLFSCNNEEVVKPTEKEDKVIDLTVYNNVVYECKDLLSDWAYSLAEAKEDGARASQNSEQEYFSELKYKLLPSAINFSKELDITREELEMMTGEKFNNSIEYEDALVGLMLFITTTDCSRVESRSGSFRECFIDAVGIGAGVALVGNLAKGTVSKAVIKKALKMVARVGTRTLNGAGLALLAAEIAWCMW
jgi:hypothetical protein